MLGAADTLYLIDANSYVYRAFFALPRLTSPQGQPVHAVFGFTKMLLRLLREAKPTYAAAVFDAPGKTFRAELFAEYKATRPTTPEELVTQLPFVREIAAACGLTVLQIPGVEADDVIATITKRWTELERPVVIVGGDKDLLQLVDGRVRVWDTLYDRWYDASEVQKKFGVPPQQIADFIALVGDSVDNIPGVRGVGEKTAQALLARYGSLEQVLAHVEEIRAWRELRAARRVADALHEQAAAARLGRQLASVRCDVPLDLGSESLRVRPMDSVHLRRLFVKLGFYSLLRELPEERKSEPSGYEVAKQPTDIEVFLQGLAANGEVAVAVIGEGLDLGTVLAGRSDQALLVPAQLLPPHELLRRVQAHRPTAMLAHDFKCDLRKAGAEDWDTSGIFDTMVAAYLLEAPLPTSLEEVTSFYLGCQIIRFRGDVVGTVSGLRVLPELVPILRALLAEREMDRLFHEVEAPLVGVLARMEAKGVYLDTAALREVGRELERRLLRLTEEIYGLAGTAFNIASPQQLREVLFGRLQLPTRGIRRGRTGLSTDVNVLSKLAAVHPLPGKILEYRTVAKLRSTYVEGLLASVDAHTGRLHTTFNQCVTATGRLSSTDPNLQNIPVRGDEGVLLRRCFTAPSGYCLVVADYSQIELRLLAHFSGDAVLCSAFENREDIHTRTAAEVFGVPPSAVTRDQRRVAKMINFGVLYGMGAASLAKELGISVGDAQRYISQYFARYAGVRAYLDTVVRQARERGYVVTLMGRRRSVPELGSPDRVVAQAAERIALNTPVQGSAADVIKLAMVALDRAIRERRLDARMVLQVHDELVFEVAEPQAEEMRTLAREVMEGVVHLRVPLVVDIGIGRNWAEAHP